ncbi:hypothetical protein GCM10007981_12900 [Thermocladium modestius]|uniref:Uncharacterized protein n=1 Tax=Thermocladium modestius TaxID=62609 RepID=A0A830GV42_9CREN|nr:hypothetical protein [Thermocladium modestius]GGP21366.1 hypothetical protein GCM10007981_12900 [Thermocladium modestius]
MEYTVVYDTYVEIPIRISKSTPDEARAKRLERWPKEAGLSQSLGEGGTFMDLVKSFARDYELETGERGWNITSQDGRISIKMEWKLLRNGEQRGAAKMEGEIPLTPAEEGGNMVYTAKIKYSIELDNDVLAEKASSDVVEFNL